MDRSLVDFRKFAQFIRLCAGCCALKRCLQRSLQSGAMARRSGFILKKGSDF
jgi:hypothetical protein